MHVHLPKPLHGWRAFAGEVGIIVVGVLIALAAEQVVDEWRWHQKTEVVRKSLMGELGNDRARWDADLAAAKCALQQIDGVDSWARTGANGTIEGAGLMRSSQLWTMHTTNWTLAANSQTLDHFPIDEQLAYAALYAGIGNRQVSIGQASDTIDRLHTLIPLASDPQARLQLREMLGDLRNQLGSLVENEGYMQRHFDALGVKADRSDFAADDRGSCTP